MLTVAPVYLRDGVFAADSAGRRLRFYDGDGKLLTPRSAPNGSWPVLQFVKDGESWLLWTYFCSGRLHGWKLSDDGRRVASSDFKADEIADVIRPLLTEPASPDLRWFWAKVSQRVVDLGSFDASSFGTAFCATEHAVATSVLQSGQAPVPPKVDLAPLWCALSDGGRSEVLSAQPLIWLRVPPDYVDDIVFQSGVQRTTASVIHERAMLFTRAYDLIFKQLDEILTAAVASMCFEGFVPIRGPLSLKIRKADLRGRSGLSVWLDSNLVSTLAEGRHVNGSGRMSATLRYLLPHLIRFFDSDHAEAELQFDLEDVPGPASALVFDRRRGEASALLPDLYVLEYARTHEPPPEVSPRAFVAQFLGRKPQIFWRGTTTGGNGAGSLHLATLADLARNPRVVGCLRLKEIAGAAADCKISRLAQCAESERAAFARWLSERSIFDVEVEEEEFARYQIYIDLPGNGRSWGTFRKYLAGCLVLVPDSPRELAYHRYLEPWRHYIPLARDLADVGDAIEWVASHREQAASIAFAGRAAISDYVRDIADHVSAALAEHAGQRRAVVAPVRPSPRVQTGIRMNVVFLQTADAKIYRPMLEATSRTVSEYCSLYGYGYESFLGIFRGYHPWQAAYNRIVLLRRLLDDGFSGWACYVDADAYIADLDFGLDKFLRTKESTACIFAPGGPPRTWWNVNNGVGLFNFAHPVARAVIRNWSDRLDAITDVQLREARDWGQAPDDQDLMWLALKHVPDAESSVWIDEAEPRTFNYDGRFIKQVLRASGTFEERLRIVRTKVDQIVGSVAEKEVNALRKDFVTALYRVALMREPDGPGLRHAVQALRNGQSFEEALRTCFVCHEFVNKHREFVAAYVDPEPGLPSEESALPNEPDVAGGDPPVTSEAAEAPTDPAADSVAAGPCAIVTSFDTIVYLDPESGLLRHGDWQTSRKNVFFSQGGGDAQGILAYQSEDGRVRTLRLAVGAEATILDFVDDGNPAQPWSAVFAGDGCVALYADGRFLCAEPDGRVTLSRVSLGAWEILRLMPLNLPA